MEHAILIVEDEQGIRDTVSVFLKNQGYKVLILMRFILLLLIL